MSNLFFFSLASPGGMFSRQFGQYGVSTYWKKTLQTFIQQSSTNLNPSCAVVSQTGLMVTKQ